MSERGSVLREVIDDAAFEQMAGPDATYVARAICEHLGITWEMVDDVDYMMDEITADYHPAARDAFATLLEAAGIER